MITLMLAASAASAECPAPVPQASVVSRLDAAEAAYAELDVDRFTAAADGVTRDVDCLSEPVTPELAARIHRIRALLQWGDNEGAARRSLAAYRRIAPELPLPTDLVPAGHPLHGALAEADPTTWDTVPEPVQGTTLSFDGTVGRQRPAHQPTIAQLARGEQIDWTALLGPDAVLPAYEMAPAPVAERGSPTRALLLTSGGSAVAAGALFGGAWLAHSGFVSYDPPATVAPSDAYSGLRSRQTLADGLTVGAGSLTAVAIGTAVAALVSR